jgi:hypothetical protein
MGGASAPNLARSLYQHLCSALAVVDGVRNAAFDSSQLLHRAHFQRCFRAFAVGQLVFERVYGILPFLNGLILRAMCLLLLLLLLQLKSSRARGRAAPTCCISFALYCSSALSQSAVSSASRAIAMALFACAPCGHCARSALFTRVQANAQHLTKCHYLNTCQLKIDLLQTLLKNL